MKIVVAIKQVPERDAQIHIAADGKWIDESDLNYTINEPDAYALEEALQLKEKNGTARSSSSAPARSACQSRCARPWPRAPTAPSISRPTISAELDTLGVAQILADAVKPESPDLILTGLQSDDLGLGQTGVVLAELLGIPHATIIMHVEATGTGLKVKRELEDGWFQHVEMPLPALLTIQSGGNKLRYATLMGIKKAKTKETKNRAAAHRSTTPAITLERVYLPEKQKKTEMLTGTPAEVATKLVEKLKFEVRVI